jgi:hypothetical protein
LLNIQQKKYANESIIEFLSNPVNNLLLNMSSGLTPEYLSEDEIAKLRHSDEIYIEIFEDAEVKKLLEGFDELVKEIDIEAKKLTNG